MSSANLKRAFPALQGSESRGGNETSPLKNKSISCEPKISHVYDCRSTCDMTSIFCRRKVWHRDDKSEEMRRNAMYAHKP